jgi:hypothetical protein
VKRGEHPWAKDMRKPAKKKEATVAMAAYLAACDERDDWKRRALDAESRLQGSGDILGEGLYRPAKGQAPNGYAF